MTETGLLVAQIVFLVLLFGFIASIVRSSSRQLGRVQPPPVVTSDPVDPPRSAPRAPAVAAPVAPAPAELRQPTLEPIRSPFHHEGLGAEAAPVAAPAALAAEGAEMLPGGPPPAEPAEPSPAEPAEGATEQPAEDAFDILEASTRVAGMPLVDLTANITPRLVVESSPAIESGSDLELEGGLTIGRSGGADLSLADQYLSHMHARIVRRGAYYFVEDLGSTNGTFLNDLRVESRAQLKVHDTLRMGQTVLRYVE